MDFCLASLFYVFELLDLKLENIYRESVTDSFNIYSRENVVVLTKLFFKIYFKT